MSTPRRRRIFIVDTTPSAEESVQVRVQKWGNSLAVRIPRTFAADIGVAERSELDMSLEDGCIVMRPVRPLRYDLDELLSGITPENLHGEAEAGPSVGGEAW